MNRIKPFFTAKHLVLAALFLSAALLVSARAELLTDAALLLLLPLSAAFLLLQSPGEAPFSYFTKEQKSAALMAAGLTALFFLMLPAWDLIASPLFSEAGLNRIVWNLRLFRLGYLVWNWIVLLPASVYAVFYCLCRALDFATGLPASPASLLGADRQKPFLSVTAMLILLLSACCLLSALPSVNGADTATIWNGSIHMQWSDWHPVTYRFFVKLCSLVHYSRFTITFVQAIAYVLVCLSALSLLNGLDRRAGRVFFLLLFLFFTPFFSLDEMSKDVAFSTALLGLTVQMLRILYAEKTRAADYLLLGLYGYIVISFRHAGALPLLGAAIPLIIFGLKKVKRIVLPTLASCGAAFLAYFLVVNVLAFGILDAIPNPGYIKYGTPMSIIAAVVKNGGVLTREETALLEEVMPEEKWASCFTKYYPGTISREYSLIGVDINNVTDKNLGPKLTLLSVRLMLRYPRTAIGTLFDNSAILWKLACPADQVEVSTLNYPLTENQTDPMDAKYTGLTEFTYRLSELFYQTPMLRSIARRGGLSLFALVFASVVLMKKKRTRALLSLCPVLLLTAGLMISVPSPCTRYALPLMEIAALLVSYALFVKADQSK